MRPIVVAAAQAWSSPGNSVEANGRQGLSPSSNGLECSGSQSRDAATASMRALDAIARCHAALERAAANEPLSDADVNILTRAANDLPAAINEVVRLQTRSARTRASARASLEAATSVMQNKSPAMLGHASISSISAQVPCSVDGSAPQTISPHQDPLRDQPEDWFTIRRRRLSSDRGGTAAVSPPVDPNTRSAINTTSDEPKSPIRSPRGWGTVRRAVVTPTQESQPSSAMAEVAVDVMREQQEDWFEARKRGKTSLSAAAEAAEQERLRLEAKRQAQLEQVRTAPAVSAFRDGGDSVKSPGGRGWAALGGIFSPTAARSPSPESPDGNAVKKTLVDTFGIDKVLLAKPAGEHWKTTIKLKRAREEAALLKAQVEAQHAEEAKWAGVPAWKRTLLETRQKKKAEAEAPKLAALQKKQEEEAKFNALPAWKQKLILNKRARND